MIGSIVFAPDEKEVTMIPRLSIGVIVLILIAYTAGAKWPVLAQKVGLA